MNKIDIKIKKVISKVLERPVEGLNKGEKWDSLTHLKIVMELENQFKIAFKTEEVFTMDSIDMICQLVKEHLHDKT